MLFTFTESQSSAIASVEIDGQDVKVSFRSNPDAVYNFVTDDEQELISFLSNPEASIGQTYHRWIREQVLIPVEALAAV
jgi:hypothetical protein